FFSFPYDFAHCVLLSFPTRRSSDLQFVKLNVESMLRGSFEEQAKIMSTSTGGPWMTRNEARALMDMSPLDEGDELIVPKNVSEGGQSSPQDGGEGRPEEDEF